MNGNKRNKIQSSLLKIGKKKTPYYLDEHCNELYWKTLKETAVRKPFVSHNVDKKLLQT